MPIEIIIIWLIVGAIAGWLAGQIVKGGGFGLVGDIVVGIIGAVVGGWLLPRLGIYHRRRIHRRDHQCRDRRHHRAAGGAPGETIAQQ